MMKGSARISTLAIVGVGSLLFSLPVWSQKFPNLPITPEQSATAKQVAQAGVPLSELAPNAPDIYVVKRGDTLWAISKMYLRSPWRWPELWGMNLEEISNPHLIFPGQTLYLEKKDGRARLLSKLPVIDPGSSPSSGGVAIVGIAKGDDTVRLSPRVRYEASNDPLTTLQLSDIEPFLAEPLIVEEGELTLAPRIVAAGQNRVIIARGDRVYARGPANAPLLDDQRKLKQYRIFRNARPLKDPETGEVLGYEAEFLGKAALIRSESTSAQAATDGRDSTTIVPATIDILSAKSEMLVGDRMAPEPEREFLSFTPHAPKGPVNGRIVSIYGSAVVNASQNQIVVINRGKRDGIERGHVLAILKDGQQLIDKTDPARSMIKLPNERNGLLMVFRTYEKLSYGLILDITDSVLVGDRLSSPR